MRTGSIIPYMKLVILWPVVFAAAAAPYTIALEPESKGYRSNWRHFAVVVPLTQFLILCSVPKLVASLTSASITWFEQLVVVAIGTFISTALVIRFSSSKEDSFLSFLVVSGSMI